LNELRLPAKWLDPDNGKARPAKNGVRGYNQLHPSLKKSQDFFFLPFYKSKDFWGSS